MAISPGKRYVYYLPVADLAGAQAGFPVVQYDTQRREKKVLAFIRDFSMNRHEHYPRTGYGMALSADGSKLAFYFNGVSPASKGLARDYGRHLQPGVMVVNIPASERSEPAPSARLHVSSRTKAPGAEAPALKLRAAGMAFIGGENSAAHDALGRELLLREVDHRAR